MSDSEWFGEPHTLTVREVTPPLPGSLFTHHELADYDIKHPPSCKQEERDYYGGVKCMVHTCDVGWEEAEGDLAFSLKYSGTPITEPGTYTIQGWGRKYYVPYYGAYEYNNGIAVIEDEPGAQEPAARSSLPGPPASGEM